MGWKPITDSLKATFEQCLKAKGVPDPYFNEIDDCFDQTFGDAVDPGPDPEPEPEPEPLPPGAFAPCSGNQSKRGNPPWDVWCVDDEANFFGAAGVLEMKCNAEAKRNRLPGMSKGVAPPTIGSNRVIMECELMFREEWLRGINAGGQHLFQIGEGPYLIGSGAEAANHLRFDFGCFDVQNSDGTHGNGFRDGFLVIAYMKKDGVRDEKRFPSSTRMPGIFVPDTWIPVTVDARYLSASGACELTLAVGSQTRQVSLASLSGISAVKLGDSLGWGNVDHSSGVNDRPGTVKIRGLKYRVS